MLWIRTRERDCARGAVDHGRARRRNAAALVADCIRRERELISKSERDRARGAVDHECGA